MASCAVRSDNVVYTASQNGERFGVDVKKRKTDYFGYFQFAFLRTELASPRGLCFRVLLHTALEFVQLPPPLVQRLADFIQLLGVPCLCFLGTLLKVLLNLTQRPQAANEVVVEDAKVGVWFCLCLATFLLQS